MDPHPPRTTSLSNTLGLEVFLIDNGVPPEIALGFCMELGSMSEKVFSGSACMLLDQWQLEKDSPASFSNQTYHEALVESLTALTGKPAIVSYVGVQDLCSAPREKTRKEQHLLFRMTRESPVRVALGLDIMTRRTHNMSPSEKTAYLLRKEIKRAIGTHKLELLLDSRFGNTFSKTLRDNIVDVWNGYGRALMTNDFRAPHLSKLCMLTRVTRLLGKIKDEPNSWASFVNHASGKSLT